METSARKISIKQVVFIILFWTLFLIIDILKKSLFNNYEYDYIYYYYFPGFFYWIFLTIPVYLIFEWSNKFLLWPRIAFLVFLGISFGIIKNVLSWVTFYAIIKYVDVNFDESFLHFIKNIIPFYYVEATIIGWVTITIFYILELNQKYKEKSLEAALLETQLTQSKLQALKMQLQPHFLFNTHNTIAMLIRTKKYDQAIDMISGLSDLLRASLMGNIEQFTSIKEEIELIKKYLYIEEIRFEDNLSVTLDINDETLSEKVPSLIFQPIIENAFKHGISNFLGVSKLQISTFIDNGYLVLKVFNTGVFLPEEFDIRNQTGIGLSNTSERLNQLYKGNATMRLENERNGVSVIIQIPLNE